MDGECGVICHLQCEITSVSVTGLCCGANGEQLFLRCHVPAGGGRAIQIDSRAAAATEPAGAVSWRDVASLSCDGSPACVREIVERRSVVFEVRRRRRSAAYLRRRLMGSELVGRAEVAWRDAGAGVDGEAVERHVALVGSARGGGWRAAQDDVPVPPVLSVRMSVRVLETAAPAGGRRRVAGSASAANWESGGEWSAGDADVFGLAVCAADGALE